MDLAIDDHLLERFHLLQNVGRDVLVGGRCDVDATLGDAVAIGTALELVFEDHLAHIVDTCAQPLHHRTDDIVGRQIVLIPVHADDHLIPFHSRVDHTSAGETRHLEHYVSSLVVLSQRQLLALGWIVEGTRI